MFYIKTKLPGGKTVKTEVTDENVFTRCLECGKETGVDLAELFSDGEGDLYSSGIICEDCAKKRMSKHFHDIEVTPEGLALLTEVMIRAGYGEQIQMLLDTFDADALQDLTPTQYKPFAMALSELAVGYGL